MVSTATVNGKSVAYETDQYGTWICVMNYEHYGGSNPSVSPGSTFPQMPNGKSDDNTVQSLGTNGELQHVDNISQYGTWNVDAVRLEATTENHNRKIHYFTTDSTVINAVVSTGSANESHLDNNVTTYSDHNANLPFSASSYTDSNSNRLFGYGFPMYKGGTHHWAVRGLGDRWEVDDYPGDDRYNTVHRAWVRVPSTLIQTEVENVLVNNQNEDELGLSWDSYGSGYEYNIYRSQTSGSQTSDYTQVDSVANTSYTDTGLEDGEKYYYRVSASPLLPYNTNTVIFQLDANTISASDNTRVSSVQSVVNNITASTPSGRDAPIYRASGLSGNPTLDFSGTDYRSLTFPQSTWDSSSQAEVWCVAHMTENTGRRVNGAPFVWMSDSNPHFTWSNHYHYTAFFRSNRSSWPASGSGVTNPHVLYMSSESGGNLRVEVNGNVEMNTSSGSFTASASQHGPAIGRGNDSGNYGFGNVSEIILRNTVSSTSKKNEILSYLQSKWNI